MNPDGVHTQSSEQLPLVEKEGKSRRRITSMSWAKALRICDSWRQALWIGAATSIVVLGFNLGFILWAVKQHAVHHGRGTLHSGNCETVRDMSTGFHVVINVLSTAVLSASNYAMVCLMVFVFGRVAKIGKAMSERAYA